MKRIAVAVLVIAPLVTVCASAKPQLERYPTTDGMVAFLVTATNTTKDSLRVRTDGRCSARVDGTVQANPSRGGSGSLHDVAPGESWKELVRLIDGVTVPTSQRPKNPDPKNIVGNVRMPVQLTPGKHVIAFNCGGEWSDDLAFDWK
jgi:hypothetical protein